MNLLTDSINMRDGRGIDLFTSCVLYKDGRGGPAPTGSVRGEQDHREEENQDGEGAEAETD